MRPGASPPTLLKPRELNTVAAHAETAIHVILDNLNTHKPRNDRWLSTVSTRGTN
jgi:hypothetical protein